MLDEILNKINKIKNHYNLDNTDLKLLNNHYHEIEELINIKDSLMCSCSICEEEKYEIAKMMTSSAATALDILRLKYQIYYNGSLSLKEIKAEFENHEDIYGKDAINDILLHEKSTFNDNIKENLNIVEQIASGDEELFYQISSLIYKRGEIIDIELSEIEKKYQKRNKEHRVVITKIVATITILTIITSISLRSNDKESIIPDDEEEISIEYLEDNGYDELISYCEDGTLTNLNNIDLYIEFSKKYDLDMKVIIKTVDEVINSYVNHEDNNVSKKEIEKSITLKLDKLSNN